MSKHSTHKPGGYIYAQHPPAWWKSRRARIVARVHTPGVTLDEVGAEFGITRERVRQIVVAEGAATTRLGRTQQGWHDAIVSALLLPTTRSWRDVARVTGRSDAHAPEFLRRTAPAELQRWRAVLRARARAAREAARVAARDESILALIEWVTRHGDRPTATAMVRRDKVPAALAWSVVLKRFGSVRALCRAAGVDYAQFPRGGDTTRRGTMRRPALARRKK